MAKRYYLVLIFLLNLVSITCCAGSSPKPEQADVEIKYLLIEIKKSNCKFIRNGSSYSAEEAKSHLEKKFNKTKDKIKTAEQFIEFIATKSSVSGELYLIECADTKTPSGVWLKKKLAIFRSDNKNNSQKN